MRSLVALLLLVTAGCANPAFSPNQFLVPEARGKFGSLDANFGPSLVTGVNNVGDTGYGTVPTAAPPALSNGLNFMLGASLGLFERFDFFLTGTNSASSMLGVKYQFMGDTAQTAKEGSTSFALAVGGSSNKASTGSTLGTPAYLREAEYSSVRVTALFGQRTSERMLYYVNPFYDRTSARLKISNSYGEIHPDGRFDSFGVTLGARWYAGGKAFFGAELSPTYVTWTRDTPSASVSQLLLNPGGVFGIFW